MANSVLYHLAPISSLNSNSYIFFSLLSSSYIGLLTVPQTYQACSYLGDWPLLFFLDALPLDICMCIDYLLLPSKLSQNLVI